MNPPFSLVFTHFTHLHSIHVFISFFFSTLTSHLGNKYAEKSFRPAAFLSLLSLWVALGHLYLGESPAVGKTFNPSSVLKEHQINLKMLQQNETLETPSYLINSKMSIYTRQNLLWMAFLSHLVAEVMSRLSMGFLD